MPYPIASCRGRNWTSGAWTPLLPTTDGGVSPHTVIVPALGLTDYFYQDSAKTTTAASDGDPVGACVNRGSDVYDVTQAVTAAKATLKLNVINGQPVLRYDGGDYLGGNFAGGAISQPFTVFALMQLDASVVDDGNNRNGVYGQGGTMALYQRGLAGADKWYVYFGSTMAGGDSNSSWNLWTVLVNGASGNFYHNGLLQGSGNIGALTTSTLYLGATNSGLSSWVGDIAYVLIYPGNLSNADKNQIGQWSNSTFGVSYTDIT